MFAAIQNYGVTTMRRVVDAILFAPQWSTLHHCGALGYNVAQEGFAVPENAVVRARIDEHIKEEATAVLAAMGLTPSDAFRMLMMRVAREKALPFEPLVPNGETIAAMREARRGGLPSFATVAELMTDLNAED